MPRPSHSVPSVAVAGGSARPTTRDIPEETAVALSYNGTTQAVMMATPADLQEFAVGFSLGEGIVDHPDQIERLEIEELDAGIDCQMWLSDAAADRLGERRRQIAGPVGCGLCGIDSLEQAMRPLPQLPPDSVCTGSVRLLHAMHMLRKGQKLHDLTRGVHGAGFLHSDDSVTVKEDVGRHNALDKLIGSLTLDGVDPASGAILLTSRVSVELVQKTVLAGAPILIAVSAPTAHAVRLAEYAGLTLIALARDERFEVFTHPHRITPQEAHNVA